MSRREYVGMGLTALWISAVAAVIIGAISLVATSPLPDVVGVEQDVAAVRLARTGFSSEVVAVRFSEEPPGTVIAQSPRGRSRVADGSHIELTVSAGTQRNTMPDLVGDTALYAGLIMREMGLSAMVVEVVSDQSQGRVISTKPAAGEHVEPGDPVTISVSAYSRPLSPKAYALEGKVVAIEPRYREGTSPDVTYEIALRLASLVEASGGTATITRKPGETEVTDGRYSNRLSGAGADAFIVLGYREQGDGGVWVADLPATKDTAPPKDSLGSRLVSALRTGSVSGTYSTSDVGAMGGGGGKRPGAVAILGNVNSSLDVAHFDDPAWRDLVARAIYLAVGEFLTQ